MTLVWVRVGAHSELLVWHSPMHAFHHWERINNSLRLLCHSVPLLIALTCTQHHPCSAKNIKNEAKKNEDVNELLIRQLREEIEALRKALANAQVGGGTPGTGAGAVEGGTLETQKSMMEEMIANLERAKQQGW